MASAGVPAVRLYHQPPEWPVRVSVAVVAVMLPALNGGVKAASTANTLVRPFVLAHQPLGQELFAPAVTRNLPTSPIDQPLPLGPCFWASELVCGSV